MIAGHGVVSDRQAGFHFYKTSTTELLDSSVSAPVMNEFHRFFVSCAAIDGALYVAISIHELSRILFNHCNRSEIGQFRQFLHVQGQAGEVFIIDGGARSLLGDLEARHPFRLNLGGAFRQSVG